MKAENVKNVDYGKFFESNGKLYLQGGQTEQGYVFKDYDAFEKKTGICYVSEYGLEKYPKVTDENGEIWYETEYNDIYNENTGLEDYISIQAKVFERAVSFLDGIRESNDNDELAQVVKNERDEIFYDWYERLTAGVFDIVDWQFVDTFLDELDFESDLIDYLQEKGYLKN